MKRIFRNQFLLLVVVYLIFAFVGFWLLTKSWLPEGFIAAGHDSGLALDSKKFLESRLWAWDDHVNFGQDNSLNFGSITIHSIDYLLAAAAGTDAAGNQLNFFFWLYVVFSSALVLGLSLRDYFGKIFVFLFPVLVTFNFYIFQSMFMLERAKYGLFAATMVFLAITFKVIGNKLNVVLGAVFSAIIFSIFNGGGLWGFPLYGGVLVMLIVLFLHTLLIGVLTKSLSVTRKLITLILLTGFLYILLNSYAILPYVVKFTSGEGASSFFSAEVIAPNKSWLDYISQASSFLSIFRLQGIPDWYIDSIQVNVNHPYAQQYQEPLLIFASFIIPLLAFLAILLAKSTEQKRLISFFTLAVLVSMVFVSGTHPPLGFIYDFLYDKVPGFAIFRTPFYKFGSVFFLGMAVLIGFSLSNLINKLADKIGSFTSVEIRNLTAVFLVITSLSLWFLYHQPLISPKVLYWQDTNTTKVKIPDYVQDFKKWTRENKIEGKILLLPPLDNGWKIDSYDWGYWSLSPLPSMLVLENTLANDVVLTGEERNWLSQLYALLTEGKEEEALLLSKRLGISYFLIRKDVSVDNQLFKLMPAGDFVDKLSKFSSVSEVSTFGQWMLFQLNDQPKGKIYAKQSVVEIPQYQLFLYNTFAKDDSIFLRKRKLSLPPEVPVKSRLVSYDCQSCELEKFETNTNLPAVTILPNSPLYILKKFRENSDLARAGSDEEKLDAYLGFALRRAGEIKQMLDFRAREKYLSEDLKVMNDYLAIVYQILSSGPNIPNSFDQTSRIVRILYPIEVNLRIEVDKAKSGTFSESVVKGMTDALWQVHRIKRLYSNLIDDRSKWAQEKVYDINFTENSEQKIFIGKRFLPFDKEGNRVFPKETSLMINGEELPLKINQQPSGDILDLTVPKKVTGQGRLSIFFTDFPNKFDSKGYKVEETPNGPVGCYYGNVRRFDETQDYKIEVMVGKKDQILKLFVREENQNSPQLTYFLRGQKEVNIFPILTYEPFSLIYDPPASSDYLGIYVCSNDKELPQVSEIIVKELFAPSITLQEKLITTTQDKTERINFRKESPVKYEVGINGSEPLILGFNERFDSLWRLVSADNSTISRPEHFVIDGYSNAWYIGDVGSGKFFIEYIPQKFFKFGLVLSITGFAIAFIVIFIFVKRGIRK